MWLHRVIYLSLIYTMRTGTVKIWDVRQKEKPVVIIEPEEGDQKRDCWTVAFGKVLHLSAREVLSLNRFV
jgi:hypothetical protein